MSGFRSCIYTGTVVHKRLEPKRHAFSYQVFTLCLDVDEIDRLARKLRLFSRGSRNLLSFHDADFAAGTGEPVGDHARGLLRNSGLDACTARVELVCYPRLLGFVFNPISVYFAYDRSDRLGAIIYEVSNTVGERRSYVLPVEGEAGGVVRQNCTKHLYVSPFTAETGAYAFNIVPPGPRILIGVNFREQDRPVLKTHFSGSRMELDDRTLAWLFLRYPLMTLKVVGGIHFEALRLWLKGVPVRPYFASPRYAATAVTRNTGKSVNV